MAGIRKRPHLLSTELPGGIQNDRGLGQDLNGLTVMDASKGGFNGYSPDLENWTSMQARTPRPLIPIVLDIPLMFYKLAQKDNNYLTAIKAMHEVHPVNVTGLTHGLNVEVSSSEIGGTGMLFESATKTTAEVSQVTFEYRELRGSPFTRLRELWIRNAIMSEKTGFPMISHYLPKNQRRQATMTLPWSTMSMAFIEPSLDGMHAEVCWIGSNMFPLSSGVIEGTRDLTTGQDVPTQSIQYAGFYEFSEQTRQVGDMLLEALNDKAFNPEAKAAHITEITNDYKSRTGGVGYIDQAAKKT